jgi:DNA-3-methyladenine glycosylase II
MIPADAEMWRDAERSLAASEPALGELMARLGPCTLVPHGRAPYHALVQSVVYQQLSGKAADTILGRLLANFGGEVPDPADLAAAPEEMLRGAGLSRAKTAALLDLARHALDGSLPDLDEIGEMSDEELIERLTLVRGVGPWTAQMYMMFGLGRPDILPITDLGVQEGARMLYGGERPSPAQLLEIGERWRPWRTVASWYMWRALDQAREPGVG